MTRDEKEAIKAALKLAERVCGSYPTPEGWEAERRLVQAAYRVLAASPPEEKP